MLSAFVRLNPNHYYPVAERLPEIRFDQVPSPVALGISPALERQRRRARSRRLRYAAQAPHQSRRRLLRISNAPSPRRRGSRSTRLPADASRTTRMPWAARTTTRARIGEIGFDARLLAAGVFDYKNEIWEIDGLRHLVEPKLSYRCAPRGRRGPAPTSRRSTTAPSRPTCSRCRSPTRAISTRSPR